MNPTGKKILLVEDEDFIRDLYLRQLTKAGFSVTPAPDGQTGLQQLKTDTFDLLLLDIMLPGMNGLQILREFKTQNPNSTMITILLTNLGQEAVIKEGFELGAQAYLIKASYTPDQVVSEVKNALAGGQTSEPTPVTPPPAPAAPQNPQMPPVNNPQTPPTPVAPPQTPPTPTTPPQVPPTTPTV